MPRIDRRNLECGGEEPCEACWQERTQMGKVLWRFEASGLRKDAGLCIAVAPKLAGFRGLRFRVGGWLYKILYDAISRFHVLVIVLAGNATNCLYI